MTYRAEAQICRVSNVVGGAPPLTLGGRFPADFLSDNLRIQVNVLDAAARTRRGPAWTG